MHREITLPEASQRLRLPYLRTYDMVLRGLLPARRDESGRWRVVESEVIRLANQRPEPAAVGDRP